MSQRHIYTRGIQGRSTRTPCRLLRRYGTGHECLLGAGDLGSSIVPRYNGMAKMGVAQHCCSILWLWVLLVSFSSKLCCQVALEASEDFYSPVEFPTRMLVHGNSSLNVSECHLGGTAMRSGLESRLTRNLKIQ